MTVITHDGDFFSWTQQQVALLRQRRLQELDIDGLIEEVEDMGLSQYRALESRLTVLLAHLLKWQYEPQRQGKSWRLTIKEQRQRTQQLLRKNPGLKSALDEVMRDAYANAKLIAARETGVDELVFPVECSWKLEQVFDDEFWPDSR